MHYAITEPLIRFHHAILRPAWSELERPGRSRDAWQRLQPQFLAQVLGPAFEAMCRTWAGRFADARTFGGPVQAVRRGLVPDAEARQTHEVDVVVLGEHDRILALGEATWGSPGVHDLDRLRRVAALLAGRGHAVGDARLALFSASGFDPALRRRAKTDRLVLVDLERLYAGT